MLEAAGGGHLVDRLDATKIGAVLDQVISTADEVRARQP
jgi:hypothetical protein